MKIKKLIKHLLMFILFTGTIFADDHGNTISSATAIDLNDSVSEQIDSGGDLDYFAISIRSSGILRIASRPNREKVVSAYLVDSSGRTIATDPARNRRYGNNFIITKELSIGTYYLKLVSYEDEVGDYEFTIEFNNLLSSNQDDHGNTISTATYMSRNGSQAGTIETVGDYDYFRISLPNRGELFVSTIYSSLDTNVYLLDSQENIINSDEYIGDSDFRAILKRELPSGTYYIKVESHSTQQTGNYDLSVVFNPTTQNSSDDHGNTISTATNVEINSSTRGRIEEGRDFDYFRISTSTTGILAVSSTGSELDTYGYLIDSQGETISRNDDSGAGYNFRISRQLSPGTYYIKVRAYSSSRTGNYSLNVQFNSIIIDNRDDHGNSMSTATNVEINSSTAGVIGVRGDYDYFKISTTVAGVLRVSSTGSLDAYGYLLDSRGNAIASNDDGGTGTNFRITREIDPGIYYIKVRSYSSNIVGSYQLNISVENILSTARNISINDSISIEARQLEESIYFTFDITTTGTLELYKRTPSREALSIYLLDSLGRTIATEDNNFRITKQVSSGTYYIKIIAHSQEYHEFIVEFTRN